MVESNIDDLVHTIVISVQTILSQDMSGKCRSVPLAGNSFL